jgi:hypothetical protein
MTVEEEALLLVNPQNGIKLWKDSKPPLRTLTILHTERHHNLSLIRIKRFTLSGGRDFVYAAILLVSVYSILSSLVCDYSLLSDAGNNTDYTASNKLMTDINKLERMWKEEVMD